MRVLITRPQPAADQLAITLADTGIASLCLPLIEIQPSQQLQTLSEQLMQLNQDDLVIAISPHAVRYSQRHLLDSGLDWPQNAQYVAVGQATAAAWATNHLNVILPTQRQNSEGVLALPICQQVQGKKVLILRGNGGRELIAQTLTQRGAEVTYLEVYRRLHTPAADLLPVAAWKQQGVDTLIATSLDLLERLVNITPPSHQRWLFQCPLIVVSDRIAHAAKHFGFQYVREAQGASDQAILSAIQQLKSDRAGMDE